MSEIDQQFIEYVVKSLVGKPNAVSVERRIDEKGVLLELTVDPEDLGRVIGKHGATAQSLRTLLRALGTKNDARYNLKIIDNGVNSRDRQEPQPAADSPKPSDDSAAPTEDDSPASTPEPDSEQTEQTEPAETVEADETAETEPEAVDNKESETSDRLARARQELADLDDLDV